MNCDSLRTALSSARAMAWSLSGDRIAIEFIASELRAEFGVNEGEVFTVDEFLERFVAQEDRSKTKRFLRNRKRPQTVYRLINIYDRPVWLKITRTAKSREDAADYFFAVDITESRAAAGELLRRIKFLDSLLENMGEGVAVIDESGALCYLNRSGEKVLGTETFEVFDRFGFPLDISRQPFSSEEVILRTRYGRVAHLEISALPLSDKEKFRGTIVTFRDVTKLKANARALAESEERFRQLAEVSLEGIVIHEQGKVIYVNRTIVDTFGYTADELIGRNVLDFVAEESKELIRKNMAEHYERPYEAVGICRNGERIACELRGRLVPCGGRILRVVAIQDITKRKEWERSFHILSAASYALSSSLDYKKTLDSIARVIIPEIGDWCVIDVEGDGQKLERVAAIHKDPAKQHFCEELARSYPPVWGEDIGITDVLRQGRTLHGELPRNVRISRLAKDRRHLEILLGLGIHSFLSVPLYSHGKIFGAVTLIYSNSARRHSQADISLVEELSRRIAVSIDNAKLYATAKQSADNRAKLLAMVSHDLRTPLTTVKLSIRTLQKCVEEKTYDEKLPRILDTIGRSVGQMELLLSDLLNLSVQEAGALSIVPKPQQIKDLLSDACREMRPVAEEKNIKLLEDPGDCGAETVLSDRARVLQIFTNLLSNSVKYTASGGTITIGARRYGDTQIELYVKDTGIGMDQTDLEHIFDPYWKAHNKASSFGLGLTIVKGLVEAQRGRVWVKSKKGEGTTVYFTLPTAQAEKERAYA